MTQHESLDEFGVFPLDLLVVIFESLFALRDYRFWFSFELGGGR